MQAEVLITHKERIRNILESKPAEGTAILDRDIEFYTANSPIQSDKFFLFPFNGPFQTMSSKLGLEEALVKFIREPRHTLSDFKDYQKCAIADYKRLKKQGYAFNGAWMWEDIAYDKGVYFPAEKYRAQLLGIHKDMAGFFASENLPLFFHCDGNVEALIPFLADIKVKALHPMQEKSNPDILEIKKVFKGIMTFIGGVGLHRINQERGALLEYIQRLKEGGNYIFSFDGPLPDGFDKEKYDNLIRDLKG